MKSIKIIYWISSGVFCLVFATTGTLYLLHKASFVVRLSELGYPLYVLDIIGTAKLLGVTALIVPRFPRLKEWAYAGFAFDLIGGAWSHLAVQSLSKAVPLLVPITIGTISYLTFHRLQSTAATSITADRKKA